LPALSPLRRRESSFPSPALRAKSRSAGGDPLAQKISQIGLRSALRDVSQSHGGLSSAFSSGFDEDALKAKLDEVSQMLQGTKTPQEHKRALALVFADVSYLAEQLQLDDQGSDSMRILASSLRDTLESTTTKKGSKTVTSWDELWGQVIQIKAGDAFLQELAASTLEVDLLAGARPTRKQVQQATAALKPVVTRLAQHGVKFAELEESDELVQNMATLIKNADPKDLPDLLKTLNQIVDTDLLNELCFQLIKKDCDTSVSGAIPIDARELARLSPSMIDAFGADAFAKSVSTASMRLIDTELSSISVDAERSTFIVTVFQQVSNIEQSGFLQGNLHSSLSDLLVTKFSEQFEPSSPITAEGKILLHNSFAAAINSLRTNPHQDPQAILAKFKGILEKAGASRAEVTALLRQVIVALKQAVTPGPGAASPPPATHTAKVLKACVMAEQFLRGEVVDQHRAAVDRSVQNMSAMPVTALDNLKDLKRDGVVLKDHKEMRQVFAHWQTKTYKKDPSATASSLGSAYTHTTTCQNLDARFHELLGDITSGGLTKKEQETRIISLRNLVSSQEKAIKASPKKVRSALAKELKHLAFLNKASSTLLDLTQAELTRMHPTLSSDKSDARTAQVKIKKHFSQAQTNANKLKATLEKSLAKAIKDLDAGGANAEELTQIRDQAKDLLAYLNGNPPETTGLLAELQNLELGGSSLELADRLSELETLKSNSIGNFRKLLGTVTSALSKAYKEVSSVRSEMFKARAVVKAAPPFSETAALTQEDAALQQLETGLMQQALSTPGLTARLATDAAVDRWVDSHLPSEASELRGALLTGSVDIAQIVATTPLERVPAKTTFEFLSARASATKGLVRSYLSKDSEGNWKVKNLSDPKNPFTKLELCDASGNINSEFQDPAKLVKHLQERGILDDHGFVLSADAVAAEVAAEATTTGSTPADAAADATAAAAEHTELCQILTDLGIITESTGTLPGSIRPSFLSQTYSPAAQTALTTALADQLSASLPPAKFTRIQPQLRALAQTILQEQSNLAEAGPAKLFSLKPIPRLTTSTLGSFLPGRKLTSDIGRPETASALSASIFSSLEEETYSHTSNLTDYPGTVVPPLLSQDMRDISGQLTQALRANSLRVSPENYQSLRELETALVGTTQRLDARTAEWTLAANLKAELTAISKIKLSADPKIRKREIRAIQSRLDKLNAVFSINGVSGRFPVLSDADGLPAITDAATSLLTQDFSKIQASATKGLGRAADLRTQVSETRTVLGLRLQAAAASGVDSARRAASGELTVATGIATRFRARRAKKTVDRNVLATRTLAKVLARSASQGRLEGTQLSARSAHAATESLLQASEGLAKAPPKEVALRASDLWGSDQVSEPLTTLQDTALDWLQEYWVLDGETLSKQQLLDALPPEKAAALTRFSQELDAIIAETGTAKPDSAAWKKCEQKALALADQMADELFALPGNAHASWGPMRTQAHANLQARVLDKFQTKSTGVVRASYCGVKVESEVQRYFQTRYQALADSMLEINTQLGREDLTPGDIEDLQREALRWQQDFELLREDVKDFKGVALSPELRASIEGQVRELETYQQTFVDFRPIFSSLARRVESESSGAAHVQASLQEMEQSFSHINNLRTEQSKLPGLEQSLATATSAVTAAGTTEPALGTAKTQQATAQLALDAAKAKIAVAEKALGLVGLEPEQKTDRLKQLYFELHTNIHRLQRSITSKFKRAEFPAAEAANAYLPSATVPDAATGLYSSPAIDGTTYQLHLNKTWVAGGKIYSHDQATNSWKVDPGPGLVVGYFQLSSENTLLEQADDGTTLHTYTKQVDGTWLKDADPTVIQEKDLPFPPALQYMHRANLERQEYDHREFTGIATHAQQRMAAMALTLGGATSADFAKMSTEEADRSFEVSAFASMPETSTVDGPTYAAEKLRSQFLSAAKPKSDQDVYAAAGLSPDSFPTHSVKEEIRLRTAELATLKDQLTAAPASKKPPIQQKITAHEAFLTRLNGEYSGALPDIQQARLFRVFAQAITPSYLGDDSGTLKVNYDVLLANISADTDRIDPGLLAKAKALCETFNTAATTGRAEDLTRLETLRADKFTAYSTANLKADVEKLFTEFGIAADTIDAYIAAPSGKTPLKTKLAATPISTKQEIELESTLTSLNDRVAQLEKQLELAAARGENATITGALTTTIASLKAVHTSLKAEYITCVHTDTHGITNISGSDSMSNSELHSVMKERLGILQELGFSDSDPAFAACKEAELGLRVQARNEQLGEIIRSNSDIAELLGTNPDFTAVEDIGRVIEDLKAIRDRAIEVINEAGGITADTTDLSAYDFTTTPYDKTATAEKQKALLAMIQSRCQTVTQGLLGLDNIKQRVAEIEHDTSISEGTLAKKILKLNSRSAQFRELEALLEAHHSDFPESVDQSLVFLRAQLTRNTDQIIAQIDSLKIKAEALSTTLQPAEINDFAGLKAQLEQTNALYDMLDNALAALPATATAARAKLENVRGVLLLAQEAVFGKADLYEMFPGVEFETVETIQSASVGLLVDEFQNIAGLAKKLGALQALDHTGKNISFYREAQLQFKGALGRYSQAMKAKYQETVSARVAPLGPDSSMDDLMSVAQSLTSVSPTPALFKTQVDNMLAELPFGKEYLDAGSVLTEIHDDIEAKQRQLAGQITVIQAEGGSVVYGGTGVFSRLEEASTVLALAAEDSLGALDAAKLLEYLDVPSNMGKLLDQIRNADSAIARIDQFISDTSISATGSPFAPTVAQLTAKKTEFQALKTKLETARTSYLTAKSAELDSLLTAEDLDPAEITNTLSVLNRVLSPVPGQPLPPQWFSVLASFDTLFTSNPAAFEKLMADPQVFSAFQAFSYNQLAAIAPSSDEVDNISANGRRDTLGLNLPHGPTGEIAAVRLTRLHLRSCQGFVQRTSEVRLSSTYDPAQIDVAERDMLAARTILASLSANMDGVPPAETQKITNLRLMFEQQTKSLEMQIALTKAFNEATAPGVSEKDRKAIAKRALQAFETAWNIANPGLTISKATTAAGVAAIGVQFGGQFNGLLKTIGDIQSLSTSNREQVLEKIVRETGVQVTERGYEVTIMVGGQSIVVSTAEKDRYIDIAAKLLAKCQNGTERAQAFLCLRAVREASLSWMHADAAVAAGRGPVAIFDRWEQIALLRSINSLPPHLRPAFLTATPEGDPFIPFDLLTTAHFYLPAGHPAAHVDGAELRKPENLVPELRAGIRRTQLFANALSALGDDKLDDLATYITDDLQGGTLNPAFASLDIPAKRTAIFEIIRSNPHLMEQVTIKANSLATVPTGIVPIFPLAAPIYQLRQTLAAAAPGLESATSLINKALDDLSAKEGTTAFWDYDMTKAVCEYLTKFFELEQAPAPVDPALQATVGRLALALPEPARKILYEQGLLKIANTEFILQARDLSTEQTACMQTIDTITPTTVFGADIGAQKDLAFQFLEALTDPELTSVSQRNKMEAIWLQLKPELRLALLDAIPFSDTAIVKELLNQEGFDLGDTVLTEAKFKSVFELRCATKANAQLPAGGTSALFDTKKQEATVALTTTHKLTDEETKALFDALPHDPALISADIELEKLTALADAAAGDTSQKATVRACVGRLIGSPAQKHAAYRILAAFLNKPDDITYFERPSEKAAEMQSMWPKLTIETRLALQGLDLKMSDFLPGENKTRMQGIEGLVTGTSSQDREQKIHAHRFLELLAQPSSASRHDLLAANWNHLDLNVRVYLASLPITGFPSFHDKDTALLTDFLNSADYGEGGDLKAKIEGSQIVVAGLGAADKPLAALFLHCLATDHGDKEAIWNKLSTPAKQALAISLRDVARTKTLLGTSATVFGQALESVPYLSDANRAGTTDYIWQWASNTFAAGAGAAAADISGLPLEVQGFLGMRGLPGVTVNNTSIEAYLNAKALALVPQQDITALLTRLSGNPGAREAYVFLENYLSKFTALTTPPIPASTDSAAITTALGQPFVDSWKAMPAEVRAVVTISIGAVLKPLLFTEEPSSSLHEFVTLCSTHKAVMDRIDWTTGTWPAPHSKAARLKATPLSRPGVRPVVTLQAVLAKWQHLSPGDRVVFSTLLTDVPITQGQSFHEIASNIARYSILSSAGGQVALWESVALPTNPVDREKVLFCLGNFVENRNNTAEEQAINVQVKEIWKTLSLDHKVQIFKMFPAVFTKAELEDAFKATLKKRSAGLTPAQSGELADLEARFTHAQESMSARLTGSGTPIDTKLYGAFLLDLENRFNHILAADTAGFSAARDTALAQPAKHELVGFLRYNASSLPGVDAATGLVKEFIDFSEFQTLFTTLELERDVFTDFDTPELATAQDFLREVSTYVTSIADQGDRTAATAQMEAVLTGIPAPDWNTALRRKYKPIVAALQTYSVGILADKPEERFSAVCKSRRSIRSGFRRTYPKLANLS
jgi:hypothetical protein